jgi:hypothetical protein
MHIKLSLIVKATNEHKQHSDSISSTYQKIDKVSLPPNPGITPS